MNRQRIKALVFHAQDINTLSYCDDWVDGFARHESLDVTIVNICAPGDAQALRNIISDFDLIVLLHSVNRTPQNMGKFNPFFGVLDRRKGRVISFVGDELNLPHALLSDKIDFLKRIEADYIATQLPLEAGRWLYEYCAGSVVVELTHALNPDAFRPQIPDKERIIDIGAICTQYPKYLGDDERDAIYSFFEQKKSDLRLTTDIRYLDNPCKRLSRSEWNIFLNSCKGTVSTEAGTFFLERDDRTVRVIVDFILQSHRERGGKVVNFKWLWNSLPSPLYRFIMARKDYFGSVLERGSLATKDDLLLSADAGEIYDRFFRDYKLPPVYTKAISSRHLEAAGTKTCQILFEGRYNDILLPDNHYIALQKDFSNIRDVIDRFKDSDYRRKMVDRAYEHIIGSHTLRHRIDKMVKLLGG